MDAVHTLASALINRTENLDGRRRRNNFQHIPGGCLESPSFYASEKMKELFQRGVYHLAYHGQGGEGNEFDKRRGMRQVGQGRSCRKGVGRGKGTYAKMRLGSSKRAVIGRRDFGFGDLGIPRAER